jgi:hypothetical protein
MNKLTFLISASILMWISSTKQYTPYFILTLNHGSAEKMLETDSLELGYNSLVIGYWLCYAMLQTAFTSTTTPSIFFRLSGVGVHYPR